MNSKRIGAAALASLLVVWGCGSSEGGARAAVADGTGAIVLDAEDVATAQLDTLAAGAVVTGTLEPYQKVEVRAQVPGVVTDLRVDRGDAVRAGQPLARIQAEGIRGQAESARAAVASAQANVALAARQLESSRRLYDAGAVSEIELRQSEAAYEAAEAQLAAARAQAAGATESAQRATVSAPITGTVSDRVVNEGEAVNPSQALLTIVNTSQLELAGRINVDEAATIRTGMPVEFRIDAYPGRVFTGTVARMDPTADPATRQVGVYVRLPNPEDAVVGGVFATGRILTGGKTAVLTVPSGAIRGTDFEPFVWLVKDGVAVRTPVQLGRRSEAQGSVEIVAGIEAGATVIVAPGEVTEGAAVQIRGAEAAPTVSDEERENG